MSNIKESKPTLTIINCMFLGEIAEKFYADLMRGAPATLEGCLIAPLSCFSQEELDIISERTKDNGHD